MNARASVRCVAFAALAAAAALATSVAGAQSTAPLKPAPSNPAASAAVSPSGDCGPCGRIVSIRQTTVKREWTPLGMGTGFDTNARAVTQFQIGPGLSNQGIVIVGAGGGAVYRKSPNSYEQPRWEVTVKQDNGQTRVVTLSYEPFVQQGDRVRISGNNVELVE
jgi:outer membrane lipoprotein SlyB